MQEFDLLVIGGGPGGYVAAIRAAQRGLSVGLVEKERPGGVCLNWGCIPTKAMLHSAEVYETVRNAAKFGVYAENVQLDYDIVHRHKNKIVKQLTDGVGGLLRLNGVTVIEGHAKFTGPTSVDIYNVGESPLGHEGPLYDAPPFDGSPVEQATARDVIVATGSVPVRLPIPGAELPGVITSDGAFGLTTVPNRIVIVGGSAVGAEWASLFASLGSDVTIVEMQPRLVPAEDADIGSALGRSFRARGITVLTESTVAGIEHNDTLLVTVDGAEPSKIEADVALVGVGRTPNTAALDLERAGVSTDSRGFISVDQQLRTNTENVYAIGDVTGKALLAHVASHQGIVAADNIAGQPSTIDYNVIPAATFTSPEIASVGLTEDAANNDGHDVVCTTFPFAALGRAMTFGSTEGFCKIVAGKQYGEVLGVHIIGPSASDLITEGALAITLEATIDELAETIHAHPTLGEVGMETALAAMGMPIHVAPPKNSAGKGNSR